MGYSWQIKPDNSMVVPILQYAPSGVVQNITIGRVKELLTAKGFNAAILVQQTRSSVTGYMIMTNFGNVNSDLNLATDVYFNKSYKNIGFTKPKSSSVSQYWMWYIDNSGNVIVNQTGSTWNGWAESKTVDGIEYYVTKMTSEPTYPPIYVTTYTGSIGYHGDVTGWRNIPLNITFPDVAQCDVTNFNLLGLGIWPDNVASYVSTPTATSSDFNVGSNFTTVMGSGSDRIDANKEGSSNSSIVRLYMTGLPSEYYSYGNEFLTSSYKWGYVACVNDETQRGFFAMLLMSTSNNNIRWWAGSQPPGANAGTPDSNRARMYTLLIGNEKIYNWQSVLSIQGNDKTYLLSSIFNINNGNPVNNVSAQGNLSLASSTEIDALISTVVLDMSKIKVTYDIPAGTYSYIKLVYKRGSAPTSVSDGTAITITQASTSQVIDGIADGGTYWFVIFTDVSKSSAKSIQTQNVPTILWDIDRGIKHSMCSDFVSVKENYDAYLWEFQDTYRLIGSGSNTPPGAGNTAITFQKGIKRKTATKMYLEIQCSRSYTLQWANSAMQLANTKSVNGRLPSGYLRVNFVSGNSSTATDNYTHTQPYYTLPKMLIEIDISSVGADTMWYLAFWKCNEYTEITKCYFNAPVEIES